MMRMVLIGTVFGLIAACAPDAPVQTRMTAAQAAEAAPPAQGAFVTALNAERAAAGRQPLVLDPLLTAAAQSHANDMVARNYFDHVSPEGTTHSDRIRAAGSAACTLGETLANGQSSERAVLAAWLASPAHRRILMKAKVNRLGLGRSGSTWVATVGGRC